MKTIKVPATVTRKAYKIAFKLKRKSPTIFVVAGIAGTAASTFLACRATLKAQTIVEDMHEQMKTVEEAREFSSDKYSDEDYKKDKAIVYAQTGLKLAKTYAPAVAVSIISVSCLLNGHKILSKRNAALATALATETEEFKKYRDRVVERFGEEVNKELKYDIKAKEFDKIVVNEKTGKEKVEKEIVDIADPNVYSAYARFYDDGCLGWTKDPDANLMFLRKQQAWANDRLKAKGYLFLNEVYEALGIPVTKTGFIVGWLYDENNPIGDNFVDFGIYDINKAKNRDFVNGYERTILLDFNCDGDILSRI